MRLRVLELKDASLMLEWMHDINVVEKMNENFLNKTEADCVAFIKSSWKSFYSDLHLAIVNDDDVYQGTVSLKNIDFEQSNAEFAITVCRSAMGTGVAKYAMQTIINFGKEKYGLEKIYWCVNIENVRACKFYDKNGYHKSNNIPVHLLEKYENQANLLWYVW